jgi:hypothetical protein
VARIAAIVGLIGAIGLMLFVGRRNDSHLLLAVFAIWVGWPFAALLASHATFAKTWSPLTRATLDILMIAVSVGTMAAYASVALRPPRARSAFLFVIVPPLTVAIVVLVLGAVALLARRATVPHM